MEMEELLAPVLLMVLIGGVSGYFAGQLVKRASGMALTFIIVAVTLVILASAGTLNVDIEWLNATVATFVGVLSTLGIMALISSVPFVASFIAGIFIGFRRY